MGRGGGGRAGGGGGTRELTAGEKDAVGDYTGARYADVNDALNAGRSVSASDAEFMDRLDSALGALPKHKGESYRVLDFSSAADAQAFADAHKVGDYVTYRGYTSTSMSREASGFNFNQATFSGQVRIKIDGTGGSKVAKHSTFAFEQEVLFKRGTKFKVTGVSRTGAGGGGGWEITVKQR